MERKNIISFGEIVWDVFDGEKILGGAPLNFAYFCAKLGADARIISAVGNDTEGREALAKIYAEGVSGAMVSKLDGLPTGRVIVSTDADGNPDYNISSPAAWDAIPVPDNRADAFARCDAFCFGTLSQRAEASRRSLWEILQALPSSAMKVFDVNLRQDFYTREILEAGLRAADIVKLNEFEVSKVSEILGLRSSSQDAAAQEIFETLMPKYLLFTKGANGSTVFSHKGEIISNTAQAAKIADTVGAGDSFTAAFTMEILRGSSTELAAQTAAATALKVVSKPGAFCL